MLQKATSTKASRPVPKSAKALRSPAPEASANPPPVVVAAKEPHPIFGITPIGKDGCTLEAQPIHALNHWHRKATKLLEPWGVPGDISAEDDKRFKDLHDITWDIYRAACTIKLYSAAEVATFLELTNRHYFDNGSDIDNIVIDRKWLRKITEDLKRLTAFPQVRKKVGVLNKGTKLTRAGLMLRYHAFLIGELRTLGWALYGNDEYATRMTPMDGAVHARTSNAYKNGKPIESSRRLKCYPFFDESKLPDRARAVLKSLKIDIEKAERR